MYVYGLFIVCFNGLSNRVVDYLMPKLFIYVQFVWNFILKRVRVCLLAAKWFQFSNIIHEVVAQRR